MALCGWRWREIRLLLRLCGQAFMEKEKRRNEMKPFSPLSIILYIYRIYKKKNPYEYQ